MFWYQFLATLYERGQGIPSGGDRRGGRKGCWCDQNFLKGDSTERERVKQTTERLTDIHNYGQRDRQSNRYIGNIDNNHTDK